MNINENIEMIRGTAAIRGDSKRRKKLMNLFLFLVLMFSQDSLIYASGEIVEYSQESILIIIRYIAFMGCFLFCAWNSKAGIGFLRFNNKKLTCALLIIVSIVASMLLNRDFDGFYIVISLILSIVITGTIDFNEYYSAFRRIMKWISLVSLVVFVSFFLFEPVLVPIRDRISTGTFFGAVIQRYLYKCFPTWTEINSGLFRERGVFAYYIIISIIILLYEDQKISKKNVGELIIYLLALLSTKGSSAFISIAILILGYILSTRKFNWKIWSVIILGVIFGYKYIISAFALIISKFDATSYLGDSGITRTTSITAALKAIVGSGGLGMGAGNFDAYYRTLLNGVKGMSSTAFTNTILGLGAYFGIVPMIISIWGIVRFSKRLKIQSIHWIFVLIVFVFNLFIQNETCMSFFWCMVLYGIFSSKEYDFDKNNNYQYLNGAVSGDTLRRHYSSY